MSKSDKEHETHGCVQLNAVMDGHLHLTSDLTDQRWSLQIVLHRGSYELMYYLLLSQQED